MLKCPTITTPGSNSRIFRDRCPQVLVFPFHPPHASGRTVMAKATKRTLEDAGEGTSPKKIKLATKLEKKRKSEAAQVPVQASSGPNDEVDFPRGGGTSFTPAEVKTIRAEAQREAHEDIFKVNIYVAFAHFHMLSYPWIGN